MKNLTLGFLGMGNIGSGVARVLAQNAAVIAHRDEMTFTIKKALVRSLDKVRNTPLGPEAFTTRPEEVVADPEIQIVVELLGGLHPARELMLQALEHGKTVVTANKAVLATYWHEFEAAARQSDAGLYYEASVCGGIPIINVLTRSMQANRIGSMMGIINGTTNYILTKMSEEGRDYADVLAEAQRLGLAEPDPSFDVGGMDAAYKLSILSSLAFHARVPVDKVFVEGIEAVTPEDIREGAELGYTLKLLAIGKKRDTTVQVRVHPTFIPARHPLSSVRDSFNAVFIRGDAVDDLMLYGRGAGDLPTASAIISDIITAAKHTHHPYSTFYNGPEASPDLSFQENWTCGFFVRLTVRDQPGVLSRIAGIFSQQNVSIASMVQKGHGTDEVPLIFVTHDTHEQGMERAIGQIRQLEQVLAVNSVIRVES
ncbi:MAG: homoserine dehydrogenase [Christensenellales bacterium]